MSGFLTALFVGALALWIGYRVGYRRGDSQAARKIVFRMMECGVEFTAPTRIPDDVLHEATARGVIALTEEVATGKRYPLPKDRRVA